MRDNAVSLVIGYMILLVITVSFLALLNAIWIPQLKQQSEVEHLNQVEESFVSLASDIDRLLIYRHNTSINQRVELGGGAVLFSPVLSSGSLKLSSKEDHNSWIDISGNNIPISFVTISYNPVNNFWINQGYTWENGTIYITKLSRKVPLEVWDNADNFVTNNLCPKVDQVSGNFTNLTISLVVINGTEDTQIGGSGVGTVYCSMECNNEISTNVDSILFSGIATSWIKNFSQELISSGVRCSLHDNAIYFDPVLNITIKKCLVHLQLG